MTDSEDVAGLVDKDMVCDVVSVPSGTSVNGSLGGERGTCTNFLLMLEGVCDS